MSTFGFDGEKAAKRLLGEVKVIEEAKKISVDLKKEGNAYVASGRVDGRKVGELVVDDLEDLETLISGWSTKLKALKKKG